ncbi:MAG: ribonuclease Z [Nitrospinae bacterium]|nr:ribonuclease Z [Nitrospinota bacterium]
MELRILGSGTSTPAPDRNCAGYLVRTTGKMFLVEAGPGTLRHLAKLGTDLKEIHHIFITHFHIDHFNDLPAILFAMKYGLPEGRGDLTIHGPEGLKENFRAIHQAYGNQIDSEKYDVKIIEHGDNSYEIESVKVTTLPMEHSAPAIGYRFDGANGKSLAYSGDTAPCSNIIKLAMGADALLMDCSRPDGSPLPGHSTTSEAAAVAKKAEVKTLILTHIYPDNDTTDLEARAAKFFDGIVIAARDGMRITL